MSATTVFGQVGSNRASTHSTRNAVIVFTVIALFALSFFVGRTTAPAHARPAHVATHAQLSPADRGAIAGDAAPITNTGAITTISPANRALIANDGTPVTTQLSQATAASCVAGRPC